ncbi:hypothetical protein [Marinimicrobium sp. C2-29]|uniref:hypothetical protein n=1 Tax=Marinimicrobium sp. C2-29 TaxID=3139825 RepID=UPI00313A3768
MKTDAMRMGTPLGWSVLMVGLLALYLVPELIFNAKLVAVVGGRGGVEDALRGIELFGRAVSGVGVSLLLADLWIRGRRAQGWIKPLGWLALCVIVVWPLVFFGQKWLIDRWLIDPSSPEQRQQAVVSQLLRASLADNTIAIDGIPPNGGADAAPSAAEMTFLTVFGALVYADPDLVRRVEDQRGTIARQFVRNRAYRDFDQHYARYRQLRGQVRERYQIYLTHYDTYTRELQGAPDRAEALWVQAEERVREGWGDYQQGVAQLEGRSAELAEQMGPRIYEYFDRRSGCSTEGCRERLDQRYDQQMQRSPLGYVEPSHWLIETEVSTSRNLVNTGLMAALTGGVSLLAQGVNKVAGGDGGWQDKSYHYTNDQAHYRERIRPLLEPDFLEQSGYPSTLGSLHEFRGHPTTGRGLVRWGANEGVVLPSGWTMDQRAVFNLIAQEAVRERINARWHEQSGGIEPGLSWDAFQRHSSVQRSIKAAMGDFYVSGALADWNNRQFKQQVVDPMVNREARRLVAEVEAQAETFADGAANEALAKRALRATLVPPISMTLSLALVLMTLVKLPLKIVSLWRERRGTSVVCRRGRGIALQVGLVLGVLAAPVLLSTFFFSNPYVEQNRATQHFLSQVRAHSSPLSSLALGWALRAQPVLLPFGLGLESQLHVYHHLQVLEPRLDGWDEALKGIVHRYQTLKDRGVAQ